MIFSGTFETSDGFTPFLYYHSLSALTEIVLNRYHRSHTSSRQCGSTNLIARKYKLSELSFPRERRGAPIFFRLLFRVKTRLGNVMESIVNQEWIVIATVFFGIIGYVAWIRWNDQRWIEKNVGRDNVIAMSFGIGYFGRTSDPEKPKRTGGFLLLKKDSLFFKSRKKNIELEIPGKQIVRIYPGSSFKGVDLHESVMRIDFFSETGEKDSSAFKVPYPPQWIQAIQAMVDRQKSEPTG